MNKIQDRFNKFLIACSILVTTLLLHTGSGIAAPLVELKVVSLSKVAETRVSRTTFDYVFKVTVRNTSAVPFANVVLNVQTVGSGSELMDGRVVVGSLAAGAEVLANDTITIRQNRTVPFAAAALTWSIVGTAGSTSQAKISALEATGAIPKLERGGDLVGPDANGNHVRDDIEAYITSNYTSADRQAAAMQAAKAIQETLLVDILNIIEAKAANRKLSYAIRCVYVRFNGVGSKQPARVVQEMEALVTNTKPRLLAYLAFNKAIDGTSWAIPEGDNCE